jgi:nucleotide-binding universal stress UspA family protein
MQTVLVGLDPPPAGTEPVRWATDYCRLTGDELAGVVAHHPPPSEPPPSWYEEELATLRKQAEAELDAISPPIPHLLEVCNGDPPSVIAGLARDEGAAMVVVGAPGSDGFRGLGLGTHHLPVPLVIVPAVGDPLRGSPVVVGLDGSSDDLATLVWAVRLAAAVEGSVCAVHASDPVAALDPHRRSAEMPDRKEAVVREQVATVATSGVDVATVVESTDPVTALTRVADHVGASLVVVGQGGAGHRGGVLLGRVPAELPFETQRPVAIVPPQGDSIRREIQ